MTTNGELPKRYFTSPQISSLMVEIWKQPCVPTGQLDTNEANIRVPERSQAQTIGAPYVKLQSEN